jgi:ABC-2 type transport system ATP-binding protein
MAAYADLRHAVKRYGKTIALDNFALVVEAGEIVALLGPNGAGKTTAINALLGVTHLQSGSAQLFGRSVDSGRRFVAVTPQEMAFPENLRVREIVEFVGRHYSNPLPVGDALERTGLVALADRRCGDLSGGETRRLAVAAAFAGNPKLVFLDEPTTGLDVESRRAVWEMIRCFRSSGGAVLLTTHYLEEAERLATRIAFIRQGRNVAADEFEQRTRAANGRIAFRCAAMPVISGDRISVACTGDGYEMAGASTDDLIKALARSGADFYSLRILTSAFEEAFVELQKESR